MNLLCGTILLFVCFTLFYHQVQSLLDTLSFDRWSKYKLNITQIYIKSTIPDQFFRGQLRLDESISRIPAHCAHNGTRYKMGKTSHFSAQWMNRGILFIAPSQVAGLGNGDENIKNKFSPTCYSSFNPFY